MGRFTLSRFSSEISCIHISMALTEDVQFRVASKLWAHAKSLAPSQAIHLTGKDLDVATIVAVAR